MLVCNVSVVLFKFVDERREEQKKEVELSVKNKEDLGIAYN